MALVLGSGLGALADQAEEASVFPYEEFSCFPAGNVAGHAARLVAGKLEGRRVLLFQGRHHLYEGHTAWDVTVQVRIARALGCSKIFLSNASGGIKSDLAAGDFLFVEDHINLLGANPLTGLSPPPFLDLSRLYHCSIFESLSTQASQLGVKLHSGILASLPGPSYETPAEIRALRALGADAVSMSTVPEAIMAKYLGMEVVAIAFISNMAAGILDTVLDHEDVLSAGAQSSKVFSALARHLIKSW